MYFGSSDELNEKTAVDLLKNNPALQSISAIQNDRIYPTPLAYTYIPGARTLEAKENFQDNSDTVRDRIWAGVGMNTFVVDFVLFLEATQDSDGVIKAWLTN